MTSVDALEFTPIDLPTFDDDETPQDPWPWRIPGAFWQHVVVLGVILFALVPLLHNGAVANADEGAMLTQLETLHSNDSWALPNPIPEVDTEGRWFGIDISVQTGNDFFTYAKHAAYPAAMYPLYGAGGMQLVVAASTLGTLLTALFAGLLARRLSPRLDTPTLWVVGIISPLFFDSYWVIAHSIGAAFATGAVLAALRVLEQRRAGSLALVAFGILGAVLFRSEGMLLGLALAGATGLHGLMKRDRLAIGAAALAGGTALGGWYLDARMYSAIVGAAQPPFSIGAQSSSWIEDRLSGAWASGLRPQLLAPTAAGGVFLAIAVLSIIAALYVRLRPTETTLIRGIAVVSAVAALGTLLLRKAPVPGLLPAFPLLPIGVLLLGRSAMASVTTRIVVVTAGLYTAAILATQYPVGGSMEWGGRFYHLMIPMLVPVLLVSVAAAGRRLDRLTARLAGGSLAVVSLVLVVFAVGTIVRLHTITGEIVDGIVTLSESTTTASEPGGPVVVSNMEAVGRISWMGSVHGRYLKVTEHDDLPVVADRLADAGIDEFVFAAAYDYDRDLHALHGYDPVPDRTVRIGVWRLYLMRRVA